MRPDYDFNESTNIGKYVSFNGHEYVIASVSSGYGGADGGDRVELLRVPDGEHVNRPNELYGYFVDDSSNEDDKLIDLVKSFRDSICDGNIKMLNEKKYIQTVINLAEGLPASKVAESLDKAAEYVRNQDTQGYWDEDID